MPVPPLPLLCDFIAVAAAPKRVEVSDWGFAKLPRELQILIMAMAHRAETIDRRRRWAKRFIWQHRIWRAVGWRPVVFHEMHQDRWDAHYEPDGFFDDAYRNLIFKLRRLQQQSLHFIPRSGRVC